MARIFSTKGNIPERFTDNEIYELAGKFEHWKEAKRFNAILNLHDRPGQERPPHFTLIISSLSLEKATARLAGNPLEKYIQLEPLEELDKRDPPAM
jgi:hypothetical protein